MLVWERANRYSHKHKQKYIQKYAREYLCIVDTQNRQLWTLSVFTMKNKNQPLAFAYKWVLSRIGRSISV